MSVDWADEADLQLSGFINELRLTNEIAAKALSIRIQQEARALDGVAWYQRDRDEDTYRYPCSCGKFALSYWRVGSKVVVLAMIASRGRSARRRS